MKKSFLKIGHRGRPGNSRYGENTVLSFELAIRAGANAIEYDIRKTKDGKLAVTHDDAISHTTNGTGKVSDYTYEELLRFNAGYGERIPLLEDVVRQFHERVFQNIEIKETGIAGEVLKILSGVKGIETGILVSAFDWNELTVFATQEQIPTALLAEEENIEKLGEYGFILRALRHGASAINPSFTATTPSLIALAHKHDLNVYPWTVNEKSDIECMKYMGVDGIISDFVERL